MTLVLRAVAGLFLLSFLLASCDRDQVSAPQGSSSSVLTSRDTALNPCADYAADSVLAIFAHIPWMPVAERGDYLYADTPQGFSVIQMFGKFRYRLIATVLAHATIVSGDYAYGADCDEISVIDVSNPRRPRLISKTGFPRRLPPHRERKIWVLHGRQLGDDC
jgi:hypothetical protein